MFKNKKTVFFVLVTIVAFYTLFLIFPLFKLFIKAFQTEGGLSFSEIHSVLATREVQQAFIGSFTLSMKTSFIATFIGFSVAYCINFTNVFQRYKRFIEVWISLPMLLPTIVYGFALIYSFGKQGLITRLLGFQLFDIYSSTGLLLGFLIYTVPISFLLINNSMKYIDSQYFIVSELMGDGAVKKFWTTIFLPLLTTTGLSMVQTFFLTFTDFGLPTAIAGTRPLIATILYNQMMGAVPNFARGAIVALVMLFPAIISAGLLLYLRRFDVTYEKVSEIILKKNRLRDSLFFAVTLVPILFIGITFSSILIVPFVEAYPYNLKFSLKHALAAFSGDEIRAVYLRSLFLSLVTGIFGVLLSFSGALVVRRSSLKRSWTQLIDGIAQITMAVPGMVLGISFLFSFSGTSLQYTFVILVIANLVHFFATPYSMATQSLEKLSNHFEKTASLLGDNYLQTLVRVIIPNVKKTLIEMFSYLFINSMVTISALIFLVGTDTTILTTKIKELQHFNKFDEIFILALLLLITNIAVKVLLTFIMKEKTTISLK